MRTRSVVLALALALPAAGGCKRSEEPAAVAVAAKVRIAPVADQHPWVIAFLTEVSITRPPGTDARLEGRTEADGRYYPEPVFEAETREALADFLRAYEQTHVRSPELLPVWEHEPAGPGRAPAWQLHFIDQQGGFELDGEASATLDQEAAGPTVRLHFGSAQRERFAALTRAHVGHRVAVVIDDEVVVLPVVKSEISGGELALWTNPGRDPEVAAPALLERLKTGN